MLFPSLLLALSTITQYAAAHGYLSSPPPRGIQKTGYQIDDLKSPNTKGLCRGEPEGQITKVKPGQTLRLGFTITAPHIGPCRVTLLNKDLSGETAPFASKTNCAAPGGPGFWDVKLPSNASGRKVLRWYWEGQHISTPGEPYEQCIDLDFGGGGGGKYEEDNDASAPSTDTQPVTGYNKPSAPTYGEDEQPQEDEEYGEEGEEEEEEEEEGDAPPTDYRDEAPPADYGDEAPAAAPQDHMEHSSSKGCQHGAFKCTGKNFARCNWGKWVTMSCAPGTVCKARGSTILCDFAHSK